jgi:hypothetical protein
VANAQPITVITPIATTKESRLTELKDLYDKGLITSDAYVEQQKKILDSTK